MKHSKRVSGSYKLRARDKDKRGVIDLTETDKNFSIEALGGTAAEETTSELADSFYLDYTSRLVSYLLRELHKYRPLLRDHSYDLFAENSIDAEVYLIRKIIWQLDLVCSVVREWARESSPKNVFSKQEFGFLVTQIQTIERLKESLLQYIDYLIGWRKECRGLNWVLIDHVHDKLCKTIMGPKLIIADEVTWLGCCLDIQFIGELTRYLNSVSHRSLEIYQYAPFEMFPKHHLVRIQLSLSHMKRNLLKLGLIEKRRSSHRLIMSNDFDEAHTEVSLESLFSEEPQELFHIPIYW